MIYSTLGFVPVEVRGGWVAEMMGEVWHHGVDDGRVNGCGPIVVEVDAFICGGFHVYV